MVQVIERTGMGDLAYVAGTRIMPGLFFKPCGDATANDVTVTLPAGSPRSRVLFLGVIYLCASHSSEDVEHHARGVRGGDGDAVATQAGASRWVRLLQVELSPGLQTEQDLRTALRILITGASACWANAWSPSSRPTTTLQDFRADARCARWCRGRRLTSVPRSRCGPRSSAHVRRRRHTAALTNVDQCERRCGARAVDQRNPGRRDRGITAAPRGRS